LAKSSRAPYLQTPQMRSLKYQMWALLVLGAALMALLGIVEA
jgi:hypothetical protein